MASVVGEASSSTLPSTSIPPRPRSCTYHVFLSFRGKDSRNGLTGHLHAALERKGIKTFIDGRDLDMGEVIKDELLKAIEESMFAITVLSPNYASSTWCLDELQHIVECGKKLGLCIVPVFYGVEPSDVRYQKGSFGEAFEKQEDRYGQNSEKVTGWRNALAELANLSGKDFKDEHEATLVESIADHIHKKLIPKLSSSTKNLVGIVSRVAEVKRHIGIGLTMNDVRFIGIWGMGGIGKTTIARTVYEAIQGEFKVSCFLANVREACERNKIVDKQKELVARVNISANIFYEYEGRRVIQHSLYNKQVPLVLDDVSGEDQLKNLAGEQDWFGLGSRIIITTRDIHLLKIYEVYETYEVQGLVESESSELFCLKAFKQKNPANQYLDLSKEVVEYSGGLPLALEVLGSYLCGRPIDVWRDAIEKIKSTKLAKIHDILKISYDGLDDMEKNIFLDVACFFKRWKKDDVTEFLELCGYKGVKIGIDILIDRALVKISEEHNVFEMHDLLQEMGRNIVIKESPNPGERSRLWSLKDIEFVFQNNKGSKAIQGVVLEEVWTVPNWSNAEAFSNMTRLKLLIISFGDDLRDLSSLPTSLKVLDWWGYPLETLPFSDQQYELVKIRLQGRRIENLWHGKKLLGKLKNLNLSDCSRLKQTPDISEAPNLQTLVLKHCWGLTEVHPSVVHHKSLTLLDLTMCTSLEALPGKLEMSSLNELILDHCWRFENLPEFGECMTSLSRLSLYSTAIKKLPTSLGCLVGLKDLNLACCKNLECLPDTVDGILRTVNMSCCNLTEESFPPDLGHFLSLTNLDLSGNSFVSIPINIHDIPKLKCLKLNYCYKLRCLPELPSSIRELEASRCDSLDISEFNILSNVCGVFVSPRQDPSQVLLEMVISGSEIPSWFVHQQDGNSISIPCDYPQNETLGIALCFQLTLHKLYRAYTREQDVEFALVVRDGNNRFNTSRTPPMYYPHKNLYIICLSNDYFSDGFHQGTCFELSILREDDFPVLVTSAGRWVSIEDVKDLK